MPIETRIDPETGFRTHVLSGEVSHEEVQQALEQVYRQAGFRPEADTLCDLRQAELGDVSSEVVKSLADFVTKRRGAPPGARTAIVADRDLDFGLARVYEHRVEVGSAADVAVFRTVEDALAWLGRVPVEEGGE